MYKKCENCYKDGKAPNDESCKKCEDDLKRKEKECENLREDIKDIANLLDLDTGEEYNFGNIEMAIKDLQEECKKWKHQAELGCETTDRLTKELEEKKQEYEHLLEAVYKDCCTHYVLGECSQEHHGNCVGRNQCIKDLEQKCKELKFKSNYFLTVYNERTQECQELERRLKNTGEEKDIHIKEKEYLYKEVERLEQKLEKIKNIAEKHNCDLDNGYVFLDITKIIEE